MVKGQESITLKRVFVVVGEPSGDRLAAELMAGLITYYPNLEFHGVGGPLMLENGLKPLFSYEELTVMGLVEVLAHYPRLQRLKNGVLNAVIRGHYDLVITVDNQDFSIRIARGLKSRGYTQPLIHYVLPTVWAWRPKRILNIRKCYDHVLNLFPFENEVLRQNQVSSTFVGHPITRVTPPSHEEVNAACSVLRLDPNKDILLVLPGSRRTEIRRSIPVFSEVLRNLLRDYPALQPVLVVALNIADDVIDPRNGWPEQVKLFDPRTVSTAAVEGCKQALFMRSKLAMAASGSVSLELAASNTPMVIGYDLNNWLSRAIIKKMLLIKTVTLINLITGTKVVPECLGKDFNVSNVDREVRCLLSNPEAVHKQLDAFKVVMDKLSASSSKGENPPARAVRDFYGQNGSRDR